MLALTDRFGMSVLTVAIEGKADSLRRVGSSAEVQPSTVSFAPLVMMTCHFTAGTRADGIRDVARRGAADLAASEAWKCSSIGFARFARVCEFTSLLGFSVRSIEFSF